MSSSPRRICDFSNTGIGKILYKVAPLSDGPANGPAHTAATLRRAAQPGLSAPFRRPATPQREPAVPVARQRTGATPAPPSAANACVRSVSTVCTVRSTMNTAWLGLVFGACCACIPLGALAQAARRPAENPIELKTGKELLRGDARETTDSARPGAVPGADTTFPKGPLGDLLRAHLLAMVGVGTDAGQKYQDAENAYQASLRAVREKGPDVVKLLGNAYARTPEDQYFRRWALVETLRELHSPDAAATLARIATSAIPAERYKNDAERSSVDEELQIRVNAVEALGELAGRSEAAEPPLLELARSPHIGLQRAAIRGYLAAAAAPEERRSRSARLERLIPAERRSLISLETTDVKSVPHPQMPEKFEIDKRRRPEGEPPRANPKR